MHGSSRIEKRTATFLLLQQNFVKANIFRLIMGGGGGVQNAFLCILKPFRTTNAGSVPIFDPRKNNDEFRHL